MRKPFPPCQNTFCCCCSVAQSCLTLCDPMDCSMPGFPVLLCLAEFAWIWSCYLTISSSAYCFSFCLQFLPASESFPMSMLFTSGGQSTGASASVLLINIQGLISFRINWLISLLSKGLSRIFSRTRIQKHQFSSDHGISQERIWSGLPFPSPGDLSNSGIKPTSPALAGRFFTTEPPGKRPQTHKLT